MALNMQPEQVQRVPARPAAVPHRLRQRRAQRAGQPRVGSEQAGKLGPLTSANRCSDCHERDGRGQPPEAGSRARVDGGQALRAGASSATSCSSRRAARVLERYEEQRGRASPTAAMVTLQRAGVRASKASTAPSSRRRSASRARSRAWACSRRSPRRDILARARRRRLQQRRHLRPRAAACPTRRSASVMRLGRFGWKAEKVSVAHQVADALAADMGVTTALLPEADGSAELDAEDFDDLVTYSRLLGAARAPRHRRPRRCSAARRCSTSIGCVQLPRARRDAPATPPARRAARSGDPPVQRPAAARHGQRPRGRQRHRAGQRVAHARRCGASGCSQTVSGHGRLLHDGRARTPDRSRALARRRGGLRARRACSRSTPTTARRCSRSCNSL